jgi:hypothetical protein
LISNILLVGGLCILLGAPAIAQEQQLVGRLKASSDEQVAPAPPTAADQSGKATAPAQPEQTTTPAQGRTQTQPQEKKEEKHAPRGAFVAAPIPISSPAIGSGVVLAAGYIFPFRKNDKVSPPSVVGAAGLFSNNGTRGFALLAQLYFKGDKYKLTSAYAQGNINYDLYGPGVLSGLKLPLKQTGEAFLGEFLRRVGWKFFLGPRFIRGDSFLTVRPNSVGNFPLPPNLGIHTTLTSLGAELTRDTSTNRFYPTDGTFFTFTSDFFSQTLGSKYSFQTYRTSFVKYWGLSENQVLAYNAFACATGGSPPFYGNCIYGANNELRGYTAGKYFDRFMLATQVEYRRTLPYRFGFVLFGGVGEAIPGGDQFLFKNNQFLPAGGGGLRFNLSRKYHVNLRADIAQGTDGHTFAMGIGEAF